MIFDMDGTLWDAVDSYCQIWNTTSSALGVDRPAVQYHELVALMGKPLAEIYDSLIGELCADKDKYLSLLAQNEDEMMPRLGGRLYHGVEDTLKELHNRGIRLFMLSNCSGKGLDNFLDFTGLRPLFEDTVTFGQTGVDKDVNLLRLKERYNLKRPVYIGDIERDCASTHAASMEFVWASYGFGKASNPEFTINSPSDLLTI